MYHNLRLALAEFIIMYKVSLQLEFSMENYTLTKNVLPSPTNLNET